MNHNHDDNISLRNATIDDATFVYALRFGPDVRKVSWSTSGVSFRNHRNYFNKHLSEYQMIYVGNTCVGFIRVNDEISIYLHKPYRGKGIGTQVLNRFSGRATIKEGNEQSRKAFMNAGFQQVGIIMEKKVKRI